MIRTRQWDKKITLELDEGVHKVVGTWTAPWNVTYQRTLSIPCNNLSIVGKGQGETTVHGGLVAEDGRSLSIADLTVKNSCGPGLYAHEMGTKMDLHKVMIEECQYSGVNVGDGAEFRAWSARQWIHDDRPSYQLHFSPQQV